jgi:hypothetical protein
MTIKRDGRYMFEYTDGEEFKCYTCDFRQFRGSRGDIDFCIRKQKVLDSSPEQGCENSWVRRRKRVY